MDLAISLAVLSALIFFGHRRNRYEERAHGIPTLTLFEQRVHYFFGWSWGLILILDDIFLCVTCFIALIVLIIVGVMVAIFMKDEAGDPLKINYLHEVDQ